MTTQTQLTDRTVLVLGATGQVGSLVTGELLARGARVVSASRRPERLDELRAALGRAGHDVARLKGVIGDLGDEASASALRDAVLEAVEGRLDGVVAALGGWRAGTPLLEVSLDDWQAVLHDNLTSHFMAARTFLPVLLRRHAGAYVPVSGPAGEIVRYGTGPVSTAVAAQRMLDAALELETRGTGVVVEELVFSGSARRPGWVDGEQLVDRVTELVAGVPATGARA